MSCVVQRAYHDQAQDGKDGHENAGFLPKRECIDLDEGLGSLQSEEGVEVWNAEEEENRGNEAKNTCRYRTAEDTSCRDNSGYDVRRKYQL